MSDFGFVRSELKTRVAGIQYFSLPKLEQHAGTSIARLPYVVRVLLEGVLRMQGAHPAYQAEHINALLNWQPQAQDKQDFPFLPARILLQDFTGVPCIADLAALRSAMKRMRRDPSVIEPRIPVDLVIDHSVQIDVAAAPDALARNVEKEFQRNAERYQFLRWGQGAFHKLTIIPPGLGICHQVNLEYLAKVVVVRGIGGHLIAMPDTVVGTDSHTTMINGLGVLGWGVGGIEAEAAMLGQPIPVMTPVVTGVQLIGRLRPGVTATDLALHLTKLLRELNVVEQFVEFFGPGMDSLSLPDRATVSNMAPEYGATTAFFPVDAETIRYLRETGRSEDEIALVEAYTKEQLLFRWGDANPPAYSRTTELDLAAVEPAVAGPKRPHDYQPLNQVASNFRKALTAPTAQRGFGLAEETAKATATVNGQALEHGSVVLASITSCTNTSNPYVMVAAGLLAAKAVAKGLRVPPTVKTSLAPGSRVVTAYLKNAGLLLALETLGFHVAAYGCATCIGNSGPLSEDVEKAVRENQLVVAAVLSGNRNFEGRVHPLTRANYLCSPPLVVAYALAGRVTIDLTTEPLGRDSNGAPVYLRDIWPTEEEVRRAVRAAANPQLYRDLYRDIAQAGGMWNKLKMQVGGVYEWDAASTYIQEPPFVRNAGDIPAPLGDIRNARALGLFGDFITTDHISPAGSIPADSPAGRYLLERGVPLADFNSYGARRGNHEIMARGTFANIRIRNRLVNREGGWTTHIPSGKEMFMYDAATAYREEGIPLIVLAGKMYGAGSSRDWAAKGPHLLGVRAVIAESFERIHRSNLVEMGILPLEFLPGDNVSSLALTGREKFSILGIAEGLAPGKILRVIVEPEGQPAQTFGARLRADSNIEVEYLRHGGILPYVLRQFLAADAPSRTP
jgi:aconitate hydratase